MWMLYYLGTQERAAKYRGVEQLVARRAHNPEVAGSSPASATKQEPQTHWFQRVCGSFCFNRTLKSLCSFCCDTNRHQCVSVLHCSGFRIFDVAKVWFSDTISCSWHQRLTPTVSLTPNDTIFVGKPYRKKSCSFEVVFQFWRGWLLLWLQRVGVKISLPELVPRLRWCQRLNREFAA